MEVNFHQVEVTFHSMKKEFHGGGRGGGHRVTPPDPIPLMNPGGGTLALQHDPFS